MGIIEVRTGGRKPVMAMVGGELVIIKRASKISKSLAIFLPSEWLKVIALKHKQKPEKFTLNYNTEVLTIKPYFGDEG